MKKVIVTSILILFLTACGPSTAQIEDAIQKTQIVDMQFTIDALSNQDSQITPTPTPDVLYIKDLKYVDVFKILNSGTLNKCEDRTIHDDGSYETTCSFNYIGALQRASISGLSEDTVFSVGCIFVVHSSDFGTEEILNSFIELVEFSNQRSEMSDWIRANYLDVYFDDSYENNLEKECEDAKLILYGGENTVSLLIIAYN